MNNLILIFSSFIISKKLYYELIQIKCLNNMLNDCIFPNIHPTKTIDNHVKKKSFFFLIDKPPYILYTYS